MTHVATSRIPPNADAQQEARNVYVGIVHTADGVLYATVAESRAMLLERIVDHVCARAEDQLWPVHSRRLKQLLDAGEVESAVALYFERVGERWDEEWLVTVAVDTIGVGALSSVLNSVV
jgi:hypothetical protein